MSETSSLRRRRELKKKRKQQQKILKLVLLILVLLVILVAVIAFAANHGKVRDELTVEAGSSLDISYFVKDQKTAANASIVTDLSTIDMTVPGTSQVLIQVGGKEYTCELTIVDTVAPTARDAAVTTNKDILPEASECVTDVTDVTHVTIVYAQEPDVSKAGSTSGQVLLTDAGGNQTTVDVTLHVISDDIAPTIEGAQDLEAYLGDSISYKSNITVTDDQDSDPELAVDNSQVDLNAVGTYPVTYTATDAAGNSSSVTINLKISEKPEGAVDEATVNALAQEVLDSITDDSMSQMEVAFAIYRWCLTNIGYTGTSDKSSWIQGAYQAFTQRSGDCFNYFAAAKALYNVAGIQNVDVVKSDTSHSSHYWSLINLGDGWYHVDCTPRKGDGDNFFMVTDAELLAYSEVHNNSHIFDGSLYPDRATTSVQDKVDYVNHKILQ